MRLRLLSMLIALPLAGAVSTAWPADSVLPTEPKKRLEALQHALISAAMEGQTRVRNAAWIDSTGKMHENTRITSEMKVRNVRVLNYLTVEEGVSAAIIAEGKGVMPDEEVCRANQQRYRREATLDIGMGIPASGADQAFWRPFMQQARARFAAKAIGSRRWSLAPTARMPETAYDRKLLGYVPEVSPYQMVIEVLPAGALGIEPVRPPSTRQQRAAETLKAVKDYWNDEPAKSAPIPFVVRLSVIERLNQRILWQDAVPLFFPEQKLMHNSQPLPTGLLTELDKVVARWQQQLDGDFGCRPQSFNVMQEAKQGWVINAGQVAGLSVGDQLLMMNREQLPARILEPDSGEHLALVEVVAVANDRAVVRKLAGSASAGKSGDWVATPF
ncbi:MAG: hypothetical protein ACKO4M_03125 [Betaproteobacteria bacterium]